jgi:hypothetical protein
MATGSRALHLLLITSLRACPSLHSAVLLIDNYRNSPLQMLSMEGEGWTVSPIVQEEWTAPLRADTIKREVLQKDVIYC